MCCSLALSCPCCSTPLRSCTCWTGRWLHRHPSHACWLCCLGEHCAATPADGTGCCYRRRPYHQLWMVDALAGCTISVYTHRCNSSSVRCTHGCHACKWFAKVEYLLGCYRHRLHNRFVSCSVAKILGLLLLLPVLCFSLFLHSCALPVAVCSPRSLLRALPRLVCCTAEVRQMRRQSDVEQQGSVAVLALGRQRAEVVQDGRNCAQSQVWNVFRMPACSRRSRNALWSCHGSTFWTAARDCGGPCSAAAPAQMNCTSPLSHEATLPARKMLLGMRQGQ